MRLIDIAENPIPPEAVVQVVPAGNIEIRTARWAPAAHIARPCPGTVLICTGRGEFIEKYAEVVGDLLQRGFAVAAFDWRGQGGSSRLLGARSKGHVTSFDRYAQDLEAVRSHILEPFCPRPWFALGHSMGGTVLIGQARHQECPFERIVLSAPMVEIFGLPARRWVRAIAAAAAWSGLAATTVPGKRGRSMVTRPFEQNVLTSDPHRYGVFSALARAAPEFQLGAPTWGWLHAAFRAMACFAELDYPRRILVPILVVACGRDRVVDTRAAERFATRLKAGKLLVVPHAEHEILMERNSMRDQFWAAFDAFVPGSPALPLAEPTLSAAG